MKSRATGLMVRFFKVVIAIGQGGMPKSTANVLSAHRLPLKYSMELGKIAR